MLEARVITAVVENGVGFEFPAPTLVPWWSFTKTVLAAAALALVADGRLSLDAPVGAKPFTLYHLLQHRAGLPEYGQLAAYREAVANGGAPWSRGLMLQRVRADMPAFEPGQDWAYSNVGYLLVREMVEKATGMDLDPALRALVLTPLGITHKPIASPHSAP